MKALIAEARTEAAAAELTASGFQGSTQGTQNSQLGQLQVVQEFGTTTGAGQSVTAVLPIPQGHTALVRYQAIGRTRIAGTAAVGDSAAYDGVVTIKNVAGTAAIVPTTPAAANMADATMANGADITLAVTAVGTGLNVVLTEVGAQGTIDWDIRLVALIN